jgi:hypothetical protein
MPPPACCPQLRQNFAVSDSWVPQLVQNAIHFS